MTITRWDKPGEDAPSHGFYLKARNGAVVMWSGNYSTPKARDFAIGRLREQLPGLSVAPSPGGPAAAKPEQPQT